MATKIRLLLGPLAAALLVSACSFEIFFIGSVTDKTVDTASYTGAILTDAPSADSDTLAPGDEKVYRVNVSSTALPALYLYVDRDIDLYVYRSTGSLHATSSSSDFFAAASAGISSAAASDRLAPSDIDVSLLCPGACVIEHSDVDDPLYVRVVNSQPSTVAFTFYAITRSFEDSSEATSGRTVLADLSFFAGAIETLGDVDGFTVGSVPGSGRTLALSGTEFGGLIYEARISDPLDQFPTRTVRVGQTTTVYAAEEIDVYVVNAADRAASAANSTYFLELY